ncbi:MAG: helix-turn-helix domain-containing protein [Steroidobacteraceae bacterium]
MGVSLDEMLARLPGEEQEAVKTRTAELAAQEMSLRDLRKALGKTQVAMAAQLGIKQENVSRIERRSDMLLSTLNGYLRGMGGRLRLVAEFEGRPPVELAGLGDIATTAIPARAKGVATRASRHKGSRTFPVLCSTRHQ